MASHRPSTSKGAPARAGKGGKPKGGKRADAAPKAKKRWTSEDRQSRAQSAEVRESVRVSRISRGRKRDLADVERDTQDFRGAVERAVGRASGKPAKHSGARPNRREREERLARDLGYDAAREDHRPDRKPAKGRSFARDERPRRFEHEDRPRYEREERSRFGREDRPRFDREDRPRFDREDRPRYERGDRPRYDRDERPRYDRDERPRFDLEDRPRYDRENRPRFDRDERPRFDREDRPRHGRDDRPRRDADRRGFGDRKPRRGDAPWTGREDRRQNRHDDRAAKRDRGFERRYNDDRPDKDEMAWEQAEAMLGGSGDGPFAELGVPADLVAALDARGITEPFPIQSATIPDALAGRDVLGRAQTGSGKTVAFGIPLLSRLAAEPGDKRPRALVLVPTRELALQVADSLSPLAAAAGLSLVLVAGGMNYDPQRRAFDRGVDVIVATPGRLIDHLENEAVDLSDIRVAVLDEADLMADMGFTPSVRQLLDATPQDGQRLLFSATLDDAVDHLVKQYMHDPVIHEIDPDAAAVSTMAHHVFHVHGADKAAVAAQVANRPGRTIVFVRTQKGADRVAGEFLEQGVLAAALHGGLTQGARARVLAAFRAGTIPVLVATDVAARGIHVDDVSLVMQLDPPADSKDYLHRAGRTARAGADGLVVTIVQPRQRKTVARLLQDAGVEVEPRRIRPGDDAIVELTGGATSEGEPIDPAKVAELTAPQQPKRSAKKGGWRGQADRRSGYKGSHGRDDRRGGDFRARRPRP